MGNPDPNAKPITVSVPVGGTAEATFLLEPKRITGGTVTPWNLFFLRPKAFDGDTEVKQLASEIKVLFSPDSKEGDRQIEGATLIFELPVTTFEDNYTWRFDADPIHFSRDTDLEFHLGIELSKDRFRMRLDISSVADINTPIGEQAQIKFVVKGVVTETGQVELLESPDPVIGIGRGHP